MGQTTTTADVERGWADAVALAERLRRGQPLPRLAGTDLPAGEEASLEADVAYRQWCGTARHAPPQDLSPVQVVVTNRRILVRGTGPGTSLWHVDLENLQLDLTGRQWQLDLHPVGINPRVRLTGGSAPLVAIHVAHTVFPATWPRLSGLLPLLDAAA